MDAKQISEKSVVVEASKLFCKYLDFSARRIIYCLGASACEFGNIYSVRFVQLYCSSVAIIQLILAGS